VTPLAFSIGCLACFAAGVFARAAWDRLTVDVQEIVPGQKWELYDGSSVYVSIRSSTGYAHYLRINGHSGERYTNRWLRRHGRLLGAP